jgi:hypothetical protein
MISLILSWGLETMEKNEQRIWMDRIFIDDTHIDGSALAELYDFCFGKLKRIIETRKVRILKPEGIEAYEELEKLVSVSGKDMVASMSAEEIMDLVLELRDEIEGESPKPQVLN